MKLTITHECLIFTCCIDFNGYGYAIEEQGRKSTLPGFITAGFLRQHLGLAGGDPQYLTIRPKTTTNRIAPDMDRERSTHHPDR